MRFLSNLFLKKLPITAAISVHYTTEDTLRECEKYFNKYAEIYDEFYMIIEGSDSKEISIFITNGQVRMSLSEFIKERMEG